mmetsp:Transcript_60357/g.167104  ORF Transcript_60357/g.167104 Transcript_60357/m.167104 type:complete len:224 (-) Transcript_60357:76-747(-)
MEGARSAEFLTKLSSVRTSPKWSFKGNRGSPRSLETPGPGTYGNVGPETPKFRRNPSYGFGTSPREGYRPHTAPGPGQYSPADPCTVSSKYGFGTAQRQGNKQAPAVIPGPGSYTHKEPMGTEGPKYGLTARREGARSPEVPGPGAYPSSETTANATQVPKYGFGTSARAARTQSLTPGPGSYNANGTMSGPKYTMSTRREGGRNVSTPGPGTYCGAHTTFGY